MEITSDLCMCLMRFTFVCYVGFICLVYSDDRCRRNTDGDAQEQHCVGNISCHHFRDRLEITWSLPRDTLRTLDFMIILRGIKINNINERIALSTSNSTVVSRIHTEPPIDFNSQYNVTVLRRRTTDFGYSKRGECTKAFPTTSSIAAVSDNIPKGLTTSDHLVVPEDRRDSERPASSGEFAIIIGLAVAVVAVLIIVVVLAVRYIKKKNILKVKGKVPRKPQNDLRGLKDDTNEEDTYNRLTLRYQENKAKQERISQDTYAHITETETQGQGENLLQAAHAPITHHYDGNYDDIPFEFEKTEKTLTASTNEPLMQDKPKVEDSKPADVKGALTGDVYATVDKGNPQQIEDGLNRAEGPKGDLYTEVAIKR